MLFVLTSSLKHKEKQARTQVKHHTSTYTIWLRNLPSWKLELAREEIPAEDWSFIWGQA